MKLTENELTPDPDQPSMITYWQNCPHCYGTGKEPTGYPAAPFTIFDCTVCKGKKIISTLTGLPPQ